MSEKTPKATHSGELIIGGSKIPCYVLENGKRVLVQRGMMTALNMKQGTASAKGAGDRLSKFIGTNAIRPYVSKELSDMIVEPINFKAPNGAAAYGYEATILAEICEAVLLARDNNALHYQQKHIAEQCEILMRGFARVGIVALVDEVTGYQEVRDRLALQAILDKYLKDEWSKWTKMFPEEYYKELFRLHGISYPPTTKNRPSYIGHWTNDIIYKRLKPGILKRLRELNPRNESGNRSRKHHQYFTEDYGVPELKELITNVIFLMKSCTTWDDFKRRLNRARPKVGDTLEMDI
ncbi:MAG TPA: P63C domain-containing protein [bacterium]|nr:P63C domain-containing protein [bacterium]